MSDKRKVDFILNAIFYGVVALMVCNMLTTAWGCAAVKPGCQIINLADMVCDYVAVDIVDPETGKRTTVKVHKSTLTSAVSVAAKQEASAK